MESLPEIKSFYAKILLFGEYTLIRHSMALTVPYRKYSGRYRFLSDQSESHPDHAMTSHNQLKVYFEYLGKINYEDDQGFKLDIGKLEKDLARGLYFDSAIPQGYGLGSSGALVAAVFYHYSNQRIPSENLSSIKLIEIKRFLSRLESFFHGTSSGLDPLLAYTGKALLITAKDHISMTEVFWNEIRDQMEIFLIDTRTTGPTRPLVEYFMEQSKDEHYRALIDQELTPAVNQCIGNLLDFNAEKFFSSLNELSILQLQCFKPMIVSDFIDIWKSGLDSDLFTLKLCGSGGGGYLLGFTRNRRQTSDFFRKFGIAPVYVIDDLL